MIGSHDEAGSPSPLMKMINFLGLSSCWLIGGKNVYEMGALGLLGMTSF